MALRGAWSRTVARPSFREMGFYASVELGTDDLVVGNPQLPLSEVESWDARVEYIWGELRRSRPPFERLLQDDRGPDREHHRARSRSRWRANALWRTFFNNPNTATLWGIELEARKNLGFLGPELRRVLLARRQLHLHRRAGGPHRRRAVARPALLRTTPGADRRATSASNRAAGSSASRSGSSTPTSASTSPTGARSSRSSSSRSATCSTPPATSTCGPDGVVTVAHARPLHRLVLHARPGRRARRFPSTCRSSRSGWRAPSRARSPSRSASRTSPTARAGIIYDPAQTSQTRSPSARYKVGRDYSFSLTYSFAF